MFTPYCSSVEHYCSRTTQVNIINPTDNTKTMIIKRPELTDIVTLFQENIAHVRDDTVKIFPKEKYRITQCLEPNNLDIVLGYRPFLRKALNFIVDKRIGVLFPLHRAKSPGRPKLPLPIELTRAEQALIDDYQALSNACLELQLIPLTPRQLWGKYHNPIKAKVGRKPLNKNRKSKESCSSLSCKKKYKRLPRQSRNSPHN
ncbi:hypothetical protein P7F88_08580 [Vibrio hannami]|uniref:hypothetical protein n=1 Tax=Vibrio hannami TaxID=2717094 RepID=UPI00240F59A0|nr:hypothetical protein [Vibrio hannami]MDG3086152.1 hypothetical protein [Vibrio hannami]